MRVVRVTQVTHLPSMDSYTLGKLSQSSDSIGVDKARVSNLSNPARKSNVGAFPLGPPMGAPAAGISDPKRTRFTNFSRQVWPHDGP